MEGDGLNDVKMRISEGIECKKVSKEERRCMGSGNIVLEACQKMARPKWHI